MKEQTHTDLHQVVRNELSNKTPVAYIDESPPPYSQQTIGSDWRHEIIEIKPFNDRFNRYHFVISGGIDNENGPWIIVTHIDVCSQSSYDNGRTKLRLFDRILSINNIDLTRVTHDEAAYAFSSAQGQSIKLHIYRLNPHFIEHIDCVLPLDMENQSLGITITGGSDHDTDDPGLFITHIDPNGLLGCLGQFRIDDRLLEIKTNRTSADLRYVTHSFGIELIRRACQDSKRVTFVVSHRTIS